MSKANRCDDCKALHAGQNTLSLEFMNIKAGGAKMAVSYNTLYTDLARKFGLKNGRYDHCVICPKCFAAKLRKLADIIDGKK